MVTIEEDGIKVEEHTMQEARKALAKAKRARAREEAIAQERREAAIVRACSEFGRTLVYPNRLAAADIVRPTDQTWSAHINPPQGRCQEFFPSGKTGGFFQFQGFRVDAYLESPNGEARFVHVHDLDRFVPGHWCSVGEHENTVSVVDIPPEIAAQMNFPPVVG